MSLRKLGGVFVRHTLPPVPLEKPAALPCGAQLVVPLSMSIGAPAKAIVTVGQQVSMGEKIAEAQGAISANVHSPVSGTVAAIEKRMTLRGSPGDCIVIDNDGLDTLCPAIVPHPEAENDPDAFVAVVREAGLVGMGGATFPTAAKISSARGKVDTLIVNASECEPGIISDYCAMLDNGPQLIHGVRLLCMATGAKTAVIAIEENKPRAIESLRPLLPTCGSMRIEVLPERYPQGGEKQLIYHLTGREIRSGGLPADVGCAVFNAESCIYVARAVESGMPLIERYCTIGGTAVKEPKVVLLRVGTTVAQALEAAGGFRRSPRKVIVGGLMMGTALFDLSVSVNKGSNGILAMESDDCSPREDASCIHCGRCIAACPMGLMPNYLNMFVNKNAMEKLQEYHLNDCLDCGCCTYGCPARLPLNHNFKLGKSRLRTWQAAEKARREAQK